MAKGFTVHVRSKDWGNKSVIHKNVVPLLVHFRLWVNMCRCSLRDKKETVFVCGAWDDAHRLLMSGRKLKHDSKHLEYEEVTHKGSVNENKRPLLRPWWRRSSKAIQSRARKECVSQDSQVHTVYVRMTNRKSSAGSWSFYLLYNASCNSALRLPRHAGRRRACWGEI